MIKINRNDLQFCFNKTKFITSLESYTLDPNQEYDTFSCSNLKDIQLKPHQIHAINRMIEMEKSYMYNNNNNNRIKFRCGILADKVGSGKSFIILGLIDKKNINLDDNINIFSNGLVTAYKHIDNNTIINTSIILVPSKIFNQWKGYIEKYTTYKCLYISNISDINKLENQYIANSDFKSYLEQFDCILINSSKYNSFCNIINNINVVKSLYFNRIIIDEAHQIPISAAKEILFKFCWLVSATIADGIYKGEIETFVVNSSYRPLVKNYFTNSDNFIKFIEETISENPEYIENQDNIASYSTFLQNHFNNYSYYYYEDTSEPPTEIEYENTYNNGELLDKFKKDILNTCIFYKNLHHGSKIMNTYHTLFTNNYKTTNTLGHKGFIADIMNDIKITTKKMNLVDMIVKSSDRFIDLSYELENYILNTIICRDNLFLNKLKSILTDDIIEAVNAGNLNKLKEHFNIVDSKSDIINMITHDMNKKISNLYAKKQYILAKEYHSDQQKQEALTKINNSITSLENRRENIVNSLNGEIVCPICYDLIKDSLFITNCCNNSFHCSCMFSSLNYNQTCPICRSNIESEKCMILDEEADKDINKLKSKNETLFDIVDSNQDKKILIFNDYDSSLEYIANELTTRNISNKFLKGNINSITNSLDNYKNGSLNVLLINSKHNAAGLNLENTDIIIIYHKLNQDIFKQVIGRAQRPGRKSALTIYQLLHSSE